MLHSAKIGSGSGFPRLCNIVVRPYRLRKFSHSTLSVIRENGGLKSDGAKQGKELYGFKERRLIVIHQGVIDIKKECPIPLLIQAMKIQCIHGQNGERGEKKRLPGLFFRVTLHALLLLSFSSGLKQFPNLIHKGVDVLKLSIHGGKTNISNLIQGL